MWIVHSYDHRRVTNAFLIQDQDPLVVRAGKGRVARGVKGRPSLLHSPRM